MPDAVALGIQVPDSFKTIGSMMDIARTAQGMQQTGQNIQRGGVELQQQQLDLAARRKLMQMGQNIDQYHLGNGDFDYPRMLQDASAIDPKLGPEFVKNVSGAHIESLAAQNAITNTDANSRQKAADFMLGLKGSPPEVRDAMIKGFKDQNPRLAPALDFMANRMLANSKTQAESDAALQQGAIGFMPATVQSELQTPSGLMVTNQAQTGMLNVKPFAGGSGLVPGTVFNNQIPLEQRQNVSINPVTQSPMVTSKDAFGNVQDVTQAPTGAGVPNLSPGGPQSVAANAGTASADWQQTFAAGQKAAQNIGVLQEIKKYAPGAVAGVAQDRRAFITGLAGLVGMDAGQMEKTDTDLLAKNTNMLALAGGNTNLAKELSEVANPNVHMTKEAITRAANQVIAQQQLNLVRAQHLQPYVNDPAKYTQAATEFNQHADPRVLQYPSLTVPEKVEMRKAMSPQERADFATKLRFFQQNGYLK